MRTGLVRGGRRSCGLTGEVGAGGEDGGSGEEGRDSDRGAFDGQLGRLVNLSLSLSSSTHSCFHTFSQSFLL